MVKSDKMAKSQKLPQMKINTDENQNQQIFTDNVFSCIER